MAELKEWVRGLVMLVLLGSCLELLIPTNDMKKYVRMTMGLVVVLAVVSPIAAFLGRPLALQTMVLGEPTGPGLPTLNQIMGQAREFRERNQGLALQEARARLADEARQGALAVAGVSRARAEIALTPQGAEYQVTGLTVVITPGAKPGKVAPVAPVRPVGTAENPTPAPPVEPTAAEAPLADAVRREVAARLGLNADSTLVQVRIDRPAPNPRR